MTAWDHGWEVLKLAAQLGGAIWVARYTVKLAVGRFKQEKSWERETATLMDMISAVGELR